MIMRDYLAYDRTILANERTLLAYIRTTIAFLAAGVTIIKIFPGDNSALIAGLGICVITALTGIMGLTSFIKMSRRLKRVSAREELLIMPLINTGNSL